MVELFNSDKLKESEKKTITLTGGEISIYLLSNSDELIPSFSGSLVRGAFLNLISQIKPELASLLHEGNKMRPYAVESIQVTSGKSRRTARGEIIVNKGDQIKLTLKLMDSKLLSSLIQILITDSMPSITLMNKDYTITNLSYKTHRVEINGLSSKLKVNFLSPTYFSILNRAESMYFPDPKYLFMNLAKIWNTFNPELSIPEDEFFLWVDNNIVINDYSTRTKRAYIGKKTPIKGFHGWVVYRFKDKRNFLPWVNILIKFGEISNVGGSRTAGFGVIRSRWIKEQNVTTES
ncbi:MAG: CRISPR-associated endoribonuclease Cas6 [Candidatus Heimdallarchaeaceae archaeon]